jgi:hypothetical protein
LFGGGTVGLIGSAARRRGQPITDASQLFLVKDFNWCKSCAMIHLLADVASHQQRKDIIMLDIVTRTAAEAAKQHGDTIVVRHKNIDDVSLYERFGQIRRVPIEAQVPYMADGAEMIEPQKMDNYHALMNVATGALLDTRPIGKSYALVPHDQVFQSQAKQLAESDLPTGNVDVLDRIYHHGKRVHRTVIFNDLQQHEYNRGGKSDAVRCRMDIFNSVDLSWAFQIFSGAYRDLCRNTLVFGGEKSYHQRKIHKGTLSPDAMIAKATMGLDMWRNNADQMKRWRQTSLTERQFADILKETICYKKTAAAQNDERLAVNEKRLNWLIERYREERPELGETMWAAYNALTHYATHLPMTNANNANREMTQTRRNNEVRAVIDSPSWQYIEGRTEAVA